MVEIDEKKDEEELVEQVKPQNALNNMLPIIVKTDEANKLLEKRTRDKADDDDTGVPEKRKKLNSQSY